MEPEGLSPRLQAPVTCPYPDPARSSPYPYFHFLKFHFTIILPSTPVSPKWSLSLRFPHQNTVYTSPLTHTRYMLRPSHYTRFYRQNSMGWGVQIIKLLIMSLLIYIYMVYIYKVNMYWLVLLRLSDRNFVDGFRNDARGQTWQIY